MLIDTEKNKAFSKDLPALQLAWDSTSLGALKTCPRKYYYEIIQGWRSKKTSIHLTFGIAYHSALELYDKAKALGKDHEAATIEAVRFSMNWGNRTEEGFSEIPQGDTPKSRWALVRSIVWYLDKFGANDPAETIILENGKPAVELSFRMDTGVAAVTGQDFLLCGHLDRVAKFGDDIFVLDRKTTTSTLSEYYFKQFTPNNQMSLYSFASQVVAKSAVRGVIIDAAQLAVGFTRFARSFVYKTPGNINEWFNDFIRWLRVAEHYAMNEHWPQNDTACDKFGGCPFREICSADPAVRDMYLKSNFEKRIWDPLEARE